MIFSLKNVDGSLAVKAIQSKISDHQHSWRYEEGPSKGPWRQALLVVADLINSLHKPPALFNFG